MRQVTRIQLTVLVMISTLIFIPKSAAQSQQDLVEERTSGSHTLSEVCMDECYRLQDQLRLCARSIKKKFGPEGERQDRPDDFDTFDDKENWADDPDPHSPELEDPVRIEADGAVIDTGKDNGHAGPLVRDWDDDGLPDLLVSAYGGNIRFFKNVGSRSRPVFSEQEQLHAGGEPIRISNW